MTTATINTIPKEIVDSFAEQEVSKELLQTYFDEGGSITSATWKQIAQNMVNKKLFKEGFVEATLALANGTPVATATATATAAPVVAAAPAPTATAATAATTTSTATTTTVDGATPKRRGRKPGSKNKPKVAADGTPLPPTPKKPRAPRGQGKAKLVRVPPTVADLLAAKGDEEAELVWKDPFTAKLVHGILVKHGFTSELDQRAGGTLEPKGRFLRQTVKVRHRRDAIFGTRKKGVITRFVEPLLAAFAVEADKLVTSVVEKA